MIVLGSFGNFVFGAMLAQQHDAWLNFLILHDAWLNKFKIAVHGSGPPLGCYPEFHHSKMVSFSALRQRMQVINVCLTLQAQMVLWVAKLPMLATFCCENLSLRSSEWMVQCFPRWSGSTKIRVYSFVQHFLFCTSSLDQNFFCFRMRSCNFIGVCRSSNCCWLSVPTGIIEQESWMEATFPRFGTLCTFPARLGQWCLLLCCIVAKAAWYLSNRFWFYAKMDGTIIVILCQSLSFIAKLCIHKLFHKCSNPCRYEDAISKFHTKGTDMRECTFIQGFSAILACLKDVCHFVLCHDALNGCFISSFPLSLGLARRI